MIAIRILRAKESETDRGKSYHIDGLLYNPQCCAAWIISRK